LRQFARSCSGIIIDQSKGANAESVGAEG
jgi:hypothetical protein